MKILPAVLVLISAAAAADDGAPPDPAAYGRLVARCLDDEPGAVAELAHWPNGRLKSLRKGFPLECTGDCVRRAALAHTAAAFVFLPRQVHPYFGKPWPEHPHLETAEWLLAREGLDRFRRDWTLAVGYRFVEWTDFQSARRCFSLALKHWQEDAEVHVAAGSFYELLDAMPQRSRAFESDRPFLPRAAAHYRRALALDPRHEEARLRLGRILVRAGDVAGGAAELRDLIEARPRPEVAALAHLFLGDAFRASGIEAVAIEAYRAALAEDPRLQPAQLALAEALHHEGRAAEASAILHQGLAAPAEVLDTWFGYHAARLHGYREAFGRLRAKVRR